MATTDPKTFPTNGLRPLTAKETLQRAKALNCIVETKRGPSCSGQINVGLFFDGTGNNMEADYDSRKADQRKHSNIVKLFKAYPDSLAKGNFAYYIPGVGTKFPVIGDDGITGGKLGGPFAWNGENRVTWAFTRILNACHLFVTNQILLDDAKAATITNNMASMFTPPALRREILRNWQQKLKVAIVSKKPKIEIINLSVFGFSRGAAEARAFSNWLFEVCENKNGSWTFADIPIRLGFLGIFDTVASVGIPNTFPDAIMEGHQSWADGNMHINPAIEQCCHFVAAHEVRASFPLDSVRVHNRYPTNAKEVMYPGAHSDLGGGYAPGDIGMAPTSSDFFAIIPGADMYQAARIAGVPLLTWAELGNERQKDFTPAAKTIEKFNSYVKATGSSAGLVEDLHKKHMGFYLSYRYKYRNDIGLLPFYQRATAKDKSFIKITTDTFNSRFSRLNAYHLPPTASDYSAKEAIAMQKKMVIAAGFGGQDEKNFKKDYGQLNDVIDAIDVEKLTPEIEDFFGNYVHDSMAGFIDMGGFFTNEFALNGMGIMRFRKIFKDD